MLVGVLLLAACGAVPASTGEAPAEKAEERAPRSEAMMEQAPKAEAKMAEPARSRPTRVPAPAAEAKAEAPASRTQSSQATTRQPAVRPPQQTAGATTFKDYPRATFVTTARDAVATFSLDTDRTSFHLALNWARSAYRVEPDSVRGPRSGLMHSTMTTRFPSATIALPSPPTSFGIPWIADCIWRASLFKLQT